MRAKYEAIWGYGGMYGWSVNVSAQTLASEGLVQNNLGSPDPVGPGIIAGTRVATTLGWCLIETLNEGDELLTFDNGVKRILEIRHKTIWADNTRIHPDVWPVVIPANELGNAQDLMLLPDQGVMLEHATLTDAMGDPFAVVPAQALAGRCGMHRKAPLQGIHVIEIFFAGEEVIYIDGGLMIHCPARGNSMFGSYEPSAGLYPVALAPNALGFLTSCDIARRSLTAPGEEASGKAQIDRVA